MYIVIRREKSEHLKSKVHKLKELACDVLECLEEAYAESHHSTREREDYGHEYSRHEGRDERDYREEDYDRSGRDMARMGGHRGGRGRY